MTLVSDDLSALPSFVTYDQIAYYLDPYKGDVGSYRLLLSLTDDNSSLDLAGVLTTEYFIEIVVTELLFEECFEGTFEDGEVFIGSYISRTMHSYLVSPSCITNEYSYFL